MYSFHKPQFRQFFKTDLTNNLRTYSKGSSEPLTLATIMEECVMYSCDMCLEFQTQSDGLLTPDWIAHITNEVYIALQELSPIELSEKERWDAIDRVQTLMRRPFETRRKVDEYYHRI